MLEQGLDREAWETRNIVVFQGLVQGGQCRGKQGRVGPGDQISGGVGTNGRVALLSDDAAGHAPVGGDSQQA